MILTSFAAFSSQVMAQDVRLKDLVNIRGVRGNFVVGFGLVVGLSGSGDTKKSLATNRAAANMLTRLGMKIREEETVAGSIAAVMVTGDLPGFARVGDKIDVKVSTVGDAKSLAGGTLIMTPLRAGDSKIYAVAQGPLVVGQGGGASVQVPTVGSVLRGATVEREFAPQIAAKGSFILSLRQPDFTTASRVAEVINQRFKGFYAMAEDLASIKVEVPANYTEQLVDFIAELERLTVTTDAKAVVVLNERSGTVVMGRSVAISPVAIAHGDLSIQIGEKNAPDSKKQSVVAIGGTTVGELLDTMNALGMKPADLVGVLQAVYAAGALQAELKVL